MINATRCKILLTLALSLACAGADCAGVVADGGDPVDGAAAPDASGADAATEPIDAGVEVADARSLDVFDSGIDAAVADAALPSTDGAALVADASAHEGPGADSGQERGDAGLEDAVAVAPGETRCGLLADGDGEGASLGAWQVEAGDFVLAGVDATRFPLPYQGQYQFFAGTTASSRLSQRVDLSDLAATVDGGLLYAHLQAHMRDWDGQDIAVIELAALDANEVPLGQAVRAQQQSPVWKKRQVGLLLPVGTRALRVALEGQRQHGNDNDAYFDLVDLCLAAEPAPAEDPLRIGPYLMAPAADGVSLLFETETPLATSLRYGTSRALELTVQEDQADTFHELRLDDLLPGTTYFYQLQGAGLSSALHRFRTLPQVATPLRVLVFGDNQNGPNTFVSLLERMAELEPDLLLSVGDTVQTGDADLFRSQMLEPISLLAAEVPFAVAGGNHERYSDADASWFDHFYAQPGDEHCFSLCAGEIFFLIIDSNLDFDPGSSQGECIATTLSSAAFASSRFQVALFHHPPRIEYWAGTCYTGSSEVRDVLQPQLEAAGVDLVLNGHAHLYAYAPPVDPLGTTWVTTGGGGGALEGDGDFCREWEEITFTELQHHFVALEAIGDTLSVTAIDLNGNTLHTFAIVRD